ncbi:MAG: hypothetical protein DI533_00315 [Cereibacter sphaeroides]|uniref:Uncharacterized protein n=1 Tax=Cereibacter sphaeroides TaxID=1063 RepID=A0A2W5SBF5_CERSP|nr:MAG: hypothetical protein DI533_00315 [Cereibacter sphaeroides]
MELAVHHDKILNTFNRIISNERDRASDAGDDRETIGNLIETCGLNKKAVSWGKALHKMEPDKREDVLRSFDALRVELTKNWDGQSTPDMFTKAEADTGPVTPAEYTKPSYSQDDEMDYQEQRAADREDAQLYGGADDEEGDRGDDWCDPADDGEPNELDEEIEGEADAFDAHLAEAAE